jgi:hypothetical protein
MIVIDLMQITVSSSEKLDETKTLPVAHEQNLLDWLVTFR